MQQQRFWRALDIGPMENYPWWFLIFVGILIPAALAVYGAICISRGVAEIPSDSFGPLRLTGFDAKLAGATMVFASLALHSGVFLSKIRFIWRLATPAAVVFCVLALVWFGWGGVRLFL